LKKNFLKIKISIIILILTGNSTPAGSDSGYRLILLFSSSEDYLSLPVKSPFKVRDLHGPAVVLAKEEPSVSRHGSTSVVCLWTPFYL
jgi:hypothetical protein